MACAVRGNVFRSQLSRPVVHVGVTPARVPTRPQHGLNVSNGYGATMMRHGKKVPKIGRPANQRKALWRALTTQVLTHGSITTTKVKAKATRKWVDKMIALAQRGDEHARRQAKAFVYDPDVVDNMFEVVPERFAGRQGGYCRVLADPFPRRGDAAEMAVLSLVGSAEDEEERRQDLESDDDDMDY